jgi:endonuclease YncB( thermonuclease family)
MSSTQLAVTPKSERSLFGYATLRNRVREALQRGRARAEETVEREKVRTSWEIGKLIHEHILLNRARAHYGEQVIRRLSRDIGMSNTELKYMLEFARTYPIGPPTGQLSWGHYRELLAVNDAGKREVLAKKARLGNWSQKGLRREIAKMQGARQSAAKAALKELLFEAPKGIPYTYQIVKLEGRLQIDLGFSNYLLLPPKYASSFKAGMIVTAKQTKFSFSLHPSPFTFHDLYTYHARLLTITDADTLWVFIDLGFGITTVQQLRLRGIDAPEIASRDGQAAKRFVEREFKNLPEIIITSTKSDKYDRYLADVFYTVSGKEKFLNNELLRRNLAVRVP